MGIVNKANTHNTIGMSKEGFVTITKIKAPDFNVLISTSGDNQLIIRGDC